MVLCKLFAVLARECKLVQVRFTSKGVVTHHSLLEPKGAAHFLPVLPHDDVLQALKQGGGNGIVPQLVELVPGDRV